MEFDYNKHIIYLTLTGSRAYGTNTPESDHDYRGIIIPPTIYNDGFLHSFEQKEGLEDYGTDSVAYNIRKFFKLAADCNPNILEILFVPEEIVVINTKYGEAIRAARRDFLSKRARYSFHGYAYAQLKRIKLHKAWWDQEKSGNIPPKPDRAQRGLPLKPRLTKDKLQSLFAIPHDMVTEAERGYVVKERLYAEDKNKYDKWRQWKENRNPKRAELEAKYGIDCKHAMHLVRLMTMCEEILRDHEVIVRRPDHQFLMDIRNGAWNYERLMEWVENQNEKLEVLGKSSTLRDKPDLKRLNELCAELVRKARIERFGN
jgi:uncharacterized protein